ncbi:MAG: 30S ribosomal protein S12 methylthiotransferase RimO [Lachnospiraceae bacterium]|nr:30S ribosomal protein S12 methylthiotransferase RimO [Lachnospiraceae bacterium]
MNVAFISLGCDKNLSDSEHMLFLCKKAGINITSEDEADVIVVNTCCFIETALEESIQNIIEAGKLKETGKLSGLVVCGCMSERYASDIRRDLPEVDAIVGTNSYDKIVEAIMKAAGKEQTEIVNSQEGLPNDTVGRITSTGLPYDYLKIAEGCDKRCTYCIIPYLRGNYRSRPMEDILLEAKQLADAGITEIDIIAQETTLYGTDLYGKKRLPELLDEIAKIDGIEWIRILYCYPESIDDDLIECMATNPKVLHYIDMPIQHCNDYILKRMNRRIKKQEILDLIEKLRERIPDIMLRTTLITGFPGETEEMHKEMLDFIREVKFDRLGAFTYSREKGTPAYDFEDQIDEKVKKKRLDQIMTLQQSINFTNNKELIGSTMKTFVEGFIPEKNLYAGRTYGDAPTIDNYVFFSSDIELISGKIVDVKITDFKDYDLLGELVK